MTALYIFLAGGLGAVLRWSLGKLTSHFFPDLPLGTVLCNLIGCFLIGTAAGLLKSQTPLSLAIMVGLLGGFTTFSSFSLDALKLLQNQQWGLFFLYTCGSLIGGLLLCWMGLLMTRGALPS